MKTYYREFLEYRDKTIRDHCNKYKLQVLCIEIIRPEVEFHLCSDACVHFMHKVHFVDGEPLLIAYKFTVSSYKRIEVTA